MIKFRSQMIGIVVTSCIAIAIPTTLVAEEKKPPQSNKKGLQQRIDFGSSYILGQSIKSGAIYLMHRKQSDIKGMLEVRQDYRNEIMEDHGLEKTALIAEVEKDEPQKDK